MDISTNCPRSTPRAPARILVVLGAIGLAGLLATRAWGQEAAQAGPAAGGPRLEVQHAEVDLGEVGRGMRPEARFLLRNTGDRMLRIERVTPACDCTVVDYLETVPPGASAELTATLDTSGYKGQLRRGIEIVTNDPRRPRLTLVLKARVLVSVDVLPSPEIYLRAQPGRRAMGRRLVRKDPGETAELELSELRASVEWLAVSARRVSSDEPSRGGLPEAHAGDWILEVRIDGGRAYGNQHATLSVATGLTHEPTIELPVAIELGLPPVTTSEETLLVHGSPEGPARGMLVLSVRQGLDPEALTVDTQPEGLEARLESAGGRMYRLLAEWARPGGKRGALTFRLGEETLRVPVAWAEAERSEP